MTQQDQSSTVVGAGKTAVRLRKPQRMQVEMMIQSVDSLVPQAHQVRTVARFVDTLDLSAFCEPIKARQGHVGQSATDPALLVSLWIYGCIRGIGSARELARRCDPIEGNASFRWLCGGVSVNHHMLSDFRVEHGDALDELFTQMVALLVKNGLVKVTRISQEVLGGSRAWKSCWKNRPGVWRRCAGCWMIRLIRRGCRQSRRRPGSVRPRRNKSGWSRRSRSCRS
jgi:transposase